MGKISSTDNDPGMMTRGIKRQTFTTKMIPGTAAKPVYSVESFNDKASIDQTR